MGVELDIVDVVRSYGIDINTVGSSLVALCPFHDDHNPSMHIYSAENKFHCFACKESGNALWFISKIEKISLEDVQNRYKDTVLQFKLKALDTKKVIDFKQETLFLLANITREYLRKNYSKLPEVLRALEKIDSMFVTMEVVSHPTGMRVVDKFTVYLESLKETMHAKG